MGFPMKGLIDLEVLRAYRDRSTLWGSLEKSKSSRGRRGSKGSGLSGLLFTEEDVRLARKLKRVLVLLESDVVKPPRRVREDSLAKVIGSLRVCKRVSSRVIENVLDCLVDSRDDPFVPRIYRKEDLLTKWSRFYDFYRRKRAFSEGGSSDDGVKVLVDDRIYTEEEIERLSRVDWEGRYIDLDDLDSEVVIVRRYRDKEGNLFEAHMVLRSPKRQLALEVGRFLEKRASYYGGFSYLWTQEDVDKALVEMGRRFGEICIEDVRRVYCVLSREDV